MTGTDGSAAAAASSAQDVVEFCIAGSCGVSVSVGSRGTISKDSSRDSSPPVAAPARFDMASPVDACTGDVMSASCSVAVPLGCAPSSVRPAWAMVGSEAGISMTGSASASAPASAGACAAAESATVSFQFSSAV